MSLPSPAVWSNAWMGVFVNDPTLQTGEEVQLRYRANRFVRWRAIGGLLLITNQRVLFQPHRFDEWFKATQWSCPAREVTGVEVVKRSLSFNPQRWRDGLMLSLVSGHEERFLVPHLTDAIRDVRRCLSLDP